MIAPSLLQAQTRDAEIIQAVVDARRHQGSLATDGSRISNDVSPEYDCTLTYVPPPGDTPRLIDSFFVGAGMPSYDTARHSAPTEFLSRYIIDLDSPPLGIGGNGVVRLAFDTVLGCNVAIKLIRQNPRDERGITDHKLAQLKLEAHISAQLAEAHFVPISDCFAMTDKNGVRQIGYCMGLVKDGRTFEDLMVAYKNEFFENQPSQKNRVLLAKYLGLESSKPIEQSEVQRALLDMFHKICIYVNNMHKIGFIHRDLKPGNILVNPFSELYLTDAGLARETASNELSLSAIGSFLYAPPEQCQAGRKHGPSSDIYSLGVILGEIINGKKQVALPEDFSSLPKEQQFKIRAEKLENIVAANVNYSTRPSRWLRFHDLEAIIRKCMAQDPSDRYSSARELANDIEAFKIGEPVAAYCESVDPVRRNIYKLTCTMSRNIGATLLAGVTLISAAVGTTYKVIETRESDSASSAAREKISKADFILKSIVGQLSNEAPPLSIENFEISRYKSISQTSFASNVNLGIDTLAEARDIAARSGVEEYHLAKELWNRLSALDKDRKTDYNNYLAFQRASNQIPLERDPFSDDAPNQFRDAELLKLFPDCIGKLDNISATVTWTVFDAHPSVFTSSHIEKFKSDVEELCLTEEERKLYIRSLARLLESKFREYPFNRVQNRFARENDAERVENLVRLVWELSGETNHGPSTLLPIIGALEAQHKKPETLDDANLNSRVELELERYKEQLNGTEPITPEDFCEIGMLESSRWHTENALTLFEKAFSAAKRMAAFSDENQTGQIFSAGLHIVEEKRRLYDFEGSLQYCARLAEILDSATETSIDRDYLASRLNFSKALTLVERLQIDPKASLEDKMRYSAEAQKILDILVKDHPNMTKFWIGLAMLKRAQGHLEFGQDNYEKAEKEFQNSRDLLLKVSIMAPMDPKPYLFKAQLDALLGDLDALDIDIRLFGYLNRFSTQPNLKELASTPLDVVFSNSWEGALPVEESVVAGQIRQLADECLLFASRHPENPRKDDALERSMNMLELAVANYVTANVPNPAAIPLGDSGFYKLLIDKFPERYALLQHRVDSIHSPNVTKSPNDPNLSD